MLAIGGMSLPCSVAAGRRRAKSPGRGCTPAASGRRCRPGATPWRFASDGARRAFRPQYCPPSEGGGAVQRAALRAGRGCQRRGGGERIAILTRGASASLGPAQFHSSRLLINAAGRSVRPLRRLASMDSSRARPTAASLDSLQHSLTSSLQCAAVCRLCRSAASCGLLLWVRAYASRSSPAQFASAQRGGPVRPWTGSCGHTGAELDTPC